MDDRGVSGGFAANALGEVVVGAVLCAIGAIGLFLFRRYQPVTTTILVLVAGVWAVGAFMASRAFRRKQERWWHVLEDLLVAITATTSLVWLLTWGCSCP